jgi:methyl-accepting chemotaxis protein
MTKMRFKLTLATLSVVIVGLFAVAVVVEIAFDNAINVLDEALKTQGKANATLLSSEVSFGVATGSQKEVENILTLFLQNQHNVKSAVVLASDQSVLNNVGNVIPREMIQQLTQSEVTTISQGTQIYASAPINNEGSFLGHVIHVAEHGIAQELRQRSRLICYSTYLIVLIMIGLGVYYIGRRMSTPVENVVDIAGSVADGDLTSPTLNISGRDEIAQLGQVVNKMAAALRDQVGAIKEAATNVMQSSGNVMSATSQLASAASEQASSIAQTTSTIEEIKQTAQSSQDSARKIVESSEKSLAVSKEGMDAVSSSTKEIKHIREQVEAISTAVEDLRTRISEVGEIISTVNQIAEQSNLLAVNASIEAAKASEYGRGFAVVAQEVKNLASQSKQATGQVRNTLGSIQKAIEDVFLSVQTGLDRSEAGVQSIEHTGETILRLGNTISSAAEDAQRIAISANEQVIGLEQVSLGMVNINQAAIENTDSTHQLEKGGEKLNSMSKKLEDLIAGYKLPK